MPSPRRRVLFVLVPAVLGLIAAGGQRWRVTRSGYRMESARSAIAAREWSRVEEAAAALDRTGFGDQAHFFRGESARLRGQPAEALGHYNEIADSGALRLQAVASSGLCLLELKNLREAERAFRFVLSENPDAADAHRGLGVIAYDLGQMAHAVDHLRRAAELDPADGKPLRLVGLIHKDMAQFEEADIAYRQALTRNLPEGMRREILSEAAEAAVGRTRFGEALEFLDRSSGSASAADTVVRVEALRGLGRTADAVAVLERAVVSFPESFALQRLRGQSLLEDDRPAVALPHLEAAIRLNPADEPSRYQAALAYGKLDRPADAARELRRVDELRADYLRLTELSRAAINRPNDVAVREQLADLCRKLNRGELASMWDRAAALLRE